MNQPGRLALAALAIAAASPQRAMADEGGVSFWLPGTYGSLAAVPAVPGWSFSAFDYYASVSAGGSADFVRGGGIVAGVKSRRLSVRKSHLRVRNAGARRTGV